MMFVWGAVTLAAFATPVLTDPALAFQWDAILHGEGKMKLPPLIMASASPCRFNIAAWPSAWVPAAQAVRQLKFGPPKSNAAARWPGEVCNSCSYSRPA